jgi:hypothetical protein
LSISIYSDAPATVNDIAVGISKLHASFPRMESDFWSVLSERIEANGFTASRLKEAVEHVLDNFRYRELSIADITRFDRRVKLYTGKEFVRAQMSGIHPSEFESREVNGVKFWVLKEDLIKESMSK